MFQGLRPCIILSNTPPLPPPRPSAMLTLNKRRGCPPADVAQIIWLYRCRAGTINNSPSPSFCAFATASVTVSATLAVCLCGADFTEEVLIGVLEGVGFERFFFDGFLLQAFHHCCESLGGGGEGGAPPRKCVWTA